MLKELAIDYDLDAPLQNYEHLSAAIRSNSWFWAHPLLSHWNVQTPLSAKQFLKVLRPYLDATDKLEVREVGPDRASHNVELEWYKGGRHPRPVVRQNALSGFASEAVGLGGGLNALAPLPPRAPMLNALADMLMGNSKPLGLGLGLLVDEETKPLDLGLGLLADRTDKS